MSVHPVVDHLAARINRFPFVERLVVFGSRARGDAQRRSDIDLAVLCAQASRLEWGTLWDWVDDAPTLLEIDLIRLDEAPERMRETIRKEGIVVYERG